MCACVHRGECSYVYEYPCLYCFSKKSQAMVSQSDIKTSGDTTMGGAHDTIVKDVLSSN
jgi:hypothetical protein